MERAEFVVLGSNDDRYEVVFEKNGNDVKANCNCQAGQKRMYCKHRFSIMKGQTDRLLSGTQQDVEKVRGMLIGSTLGDAYTRLIEAEALQDEHKRRIDKIKKEIEKAMYP